MLKATTPLETLPPPYGRIPKIFLAKCGLNMQKRIWWTSVGAVSFFEETLFLFTLTPYSHIW